MPLCCDLLAHQSCFAVDNFKLDYNTYSYLKMIRIFNVSTYEGFFSREGKKLGSMQTRNHAFADNIVFQECLEPEEVLCNLSDFESSSFFT